MLSDHFSLCEVAAVQKIKWLMVQEPPPSLFNYFTELSSIGAKILDGKGLKKATNQKECLSVSSPHNKVGVNGWEVHV